MEALQLSVLDLPPQNVLGILPRFKIAVSGKDADAIARFEEAIGEIRLDQLPDELAGNGKSDRHTQAVIPIEIKVGDRAGSNGEYADQFEIGDRVIFPNPTTPNQAKRGIGVVVKVNDLNVCVRWQNTKPVKWQENGVYQEINYEVHLRQFCEVKKVLGYESDKDIHIPELSRNGCIEWYSVINRQGKKYKYWRYVYLDAKGIYRHHHIPYKQIEAITALWAGGKSAKEICVAIGKKYLGKDSA